MASITGRSAIIALEPSASTWGTAVAPGALDGLLLESFGPLGEQAEMHPDYVAGYQWHENIYKGRQTLNPEISGPLRYSTRLWTLVAQLMGLDTKTGSGTYTHTITCLDAIDGSDLFSTLAAELGGSLIFEWPSVKPTGFTIEGPDDKGYVSISVRTIADCCLLGADGTTAAADFDNVTYMQISSALAKKIPFGALRLRMNWDAGALDAADNITNVKRFALSFDRQFGPEWANRSARTAEWRTAEPIEDGIPVWTFELDLADLNALTHLEAMQDETTAKAELYFDADATNSVTISLPLLKTMPSDASISGPARIPQGLKFQAMEAAANPTGMSDTTPYIVVVDPESNAYE